jgi:AcrR family transcriptional regulator
VEDVLMGRKSKADVRKPEILKSAYEVVKREGLERTTLARIAAHMGVATSLLTHYFKSKEDIIESLADYMVEVYDESLMLDFKKIPSAEKRIEAMLDARFYEYSRQVIDDKVWFDVYNLSLRNKRIKDFFIDLYERDKAAVEAEIGELIDNKEGGKSVTSDLSTAMIVMMEGISYYNSIMGDTHDIRGAVELMEDMFMSYFKKLNSG